MHAPSSSPAVPGVSAPGRRRSGWSDGRKIVVERYEEAEVRQPIGDVGAAFLTSTTLKFVAPPELATLPVLTIDCRPLILDFEPAIGTWFVIAFDERACMQPIPEAIHAGIMDESGRINLRPNAEYRLLDGKWVGVPLVTDRIGFPVNLLVQRMTVEYWSDKGTAGSVGGETPAGFASACANTVPQDPTADRLRLNSSCVLIVDFLKRVVTPPWITSSTAVHPRKM